MQMLQRRVLPLIAIALGMTLLSQAHVQAWPSSRSAKVAARLAKYRPYNWLGHYLPEDRYLLAGKTWNFVSTQLDPRYHRADCPNMMRQPANIALGFFSIREAREAGYIPCPTCRPLQPATVVRYRSGALVTINRGRTAKTIVLADKVSTISLPPNWKRTQSGAESIMGAVVLADTLEPLKGRGYVKVVTKVMPMDVGPLLTPPAFAAFVNSRQPTIASQIDIKSGQTGGLKGITLTPKGNSEVTLIGSSTTVVARGAKIYAVTVEPGTTGLDAIVKSFKPR